MMDTYDILVRPIITERSIADAEKKKYTFEVNRKANKYQIKDAVQDAFKVKVVKVNTMNMRGKKKRQGRTEGYTPAWKKAIVTLSQDSDEIKLFNT
ncbi:MAG: 50S ribosomal protein L23 [Eubacteriaceae bacterium]|nr:50S ribosomal protein L23 [Eubacteriaceae bacterium]